MVSPTRRSGRPFNRDLSRPIPDATTTGTACGVRHVMRRALINDPKHWRSRAEETRAIARDLDDPQAKWAMERIAEEYDRLAERAEERRRLKN
jgi:hypothetical protein